MSRAVVQVTEAGPHRAVQESHGQPGRDNLLRAPHISKTLLAAARARESRAHFLAEVLGGGLATVDSPWVACQSGDRRLLRVRLRQLLATAPHWDTGRTDAALGHIAAVTGSPGPELNTAPLAWLVDSRAAGRRMVAWLDAFRPRNAPWPGFPFAPLPDSFPAEGPGNPPALAARDRAGVPRDSK